MATLTIRNLPDEVYEQLKQAAEQNRRSLNNEAIVWLERARLQAQQRTPEEVEEILARARALREKVSFYITSDEELTRLKREGHL